MDDHELAELDYCYLTTTGRASGRPHTIEIWFALSGDTLYVLSGGGDASDWVKNVAAHPTVGLRLGDLDMICRGRVVSDPAEDELARRLLLDKYVPRSSDDLTEWGRTALPIAVDLPPVADQAPA
ncbi:MAG TPA: nitroreductase/quinone reductase family protein [Actinomycetota bacterium]|nr:nitroreductase/quinone reductase family protein [Actinomycetota bacterium]